VDISFASTHSRCVAWLTELILQMTRLYQRLPNQPLIPSRVLETDSNTSDGGGEGEDESSDDDHGAADDEE